jgi:hypothetical protein
MKNNSACHDRGQVQRKELAKDVTQRQQIQKANWVHQSLILQIFSDFRLKRCEIGEHIPVCDDYAFRLSRGA